MKRALPFLLFSLAACTATPELRLKSADMTMELKQAAPMVSSVAFSPDMRYALSGSMKESATLWDLAAASAVHTFRAPRGFMADGLMVAFSPDGKYGLTGGKGLKVWDLATGEEERTFGKGRVQAIAWTPDGRHVLTGGGEGGNAITFDLSRHLTLWDWNTGSAAREFPFIGENTNEGVISAVISPDGRFMLAGQNSPGDVVLWDLAKGKRVRQARASEGGPFKPSVVYAVSFSPDGKRALSGSYDGYLRLWNVPSLALARTIQAHPGAVNAVTAAIFSPDGRHALTGGASDGMIKVWDLSTGAEVRSIPAHAGMTSPVSLAFSRDGKLLLSGGDASVRVWDYSTGEEVATLVSFEDGEWVAITPNGYYNASAKGDEYLNVAVGGKPFSIAQLRESFYRPDLVKIALGGGSLKEFRRLADIKQPPTVAIVDTPGSVAGQEATITLRISDTGGGIGDIRLYLNGTAVVLDGGRGIAVVPTKSASDIYKKYTVKLSSGMNSIRAIAFNGDNTMQSADALQEITSSFRAAARPSLYALVIGINEYKNPKLQLNFAVADAGLFADTLKRSSAPLFDKVVVKRLLTPAETTQENILKELRSFRSLNPDDLFVFYVASHGTVDDGEYFLITSNVGSTSTAKLKADAISQNALKEIVANIPATKKLIVIDTCSAGKLGDAIQTAMLTRGMSEDTAMKVLSRAVGSTILSASTSVQEALEGYNGHGLFTYVLAEGLGGKADKGRSGFVRTTELADYVDNEVPVLAEKVFKKAQYPTISISGMGFPIGQTK